MYHQYVPPTSPICITIIFQTLPPTAPYRTTLAMRTHHSTPHSSWWLATPRPTAHDDSPLHAPQLMMTCHSIFHSSWRFTSTRPTGHEDSPLHIPHLMKIHQYTPYWSWWRATPYSATHEDSAVHAPYIVRTCHSMSHTAHEDSPIHALLPMRIRHEDSPVHAMSTRMISDNHTITFRKITARTHCNIVHHSKGCWEAMAPFFTKALLVVHKRERDGVCYIKVHIQRFWMYRYIGFHI